jgi:uncharacterized protein (TIGR04255 family)
MDFVFTDVFRSEFLKKIFLFPEITMSFPDVQKVFFKNNPLDQVICQLKFPPILRIDAGIPDDFQEEIRTDFPSYSKSNAINIIIPPDFAGGVPVNIIGQMVQSADALNHEFGSEDGSWKINLVRDFVALTTTQYGHWHEFREKFTIPLNALKKIYSPPYFLRVGLRYINIIKRSKVGLSDVPWSKLLQPHITGLLGTNEIGADVKNFETRHEVGLGNDNSAVQIRTNFVQPINDQEICFQIDSDFFLMQKVSSGSEMDILEKFHENAARLIQWCISPILRDAMEPQAVSS